MITFYPGPSKVYSEVPIYVEEAYDMGILSINHRSPEFMELYQIVVKLMKDKLDLPEDYTVLFSSSATECWEIISQSLVEETSLHVFNGAFGEKWLQYASSLVPSIERLTFNVEELPNIEKIGKSDADLIALTHNETSNGTALPVEWMCELRKSNPDKVIAVDATSSMAGVNLAWTVADVWFASLQKCFGLPAGLAVMILSPQAVERTERLAEKKHYNSLINIFDQSKRHQTTHTPNILGIYLLSRVLEARKPISEVSNIITQQYDKWVNLLSNYCYVKLPVLNDEVRSRTVIPLQGEASTIQKLKKEAKASGIILGNGYGELKEITLRIANFPAITKNEIDQLMKFFNNFVPD